MFHLSSNDPSTGDIGLTTLGFFRESTKVRCLLYKFEVHPFYKGLYDDLSNFFLGQERYIY